MRGFTALILVTFVSQTYAEESSSSSTSNAQNAMLKMEDTLFERKQSARSAQNAGLDNTLFGKAGHLANVRQKPGFLQMKPGISSQPGFPSVSQAVPVVLGPCVAQAEAAPLTRLRLYNLPSLKTKLKIRGGRGYGGKKGGTWGKGTGGQKTRASRLPFNRKTGFEGGQTTAIKTAGKPRGKGIKYPEWRFKYFTLQQIQTYIDGGKLDANEPITTELLRKKHIVGKQDNVKIYVGRSGERLTSKVKIQVQAASGGAVAALQEQGSKLYFAPRYPCRVDPVPEDDE